MPIAIALLPGGIIPGIFAADDPDALLATLRGLVGAPGLPDVAAARAWLLTLPEPSGWFDTLAEANAHLDRLQSEEAPMTGDEVLAARKALGMGRAEFAAAIGHEGNQNTRNKMVWEVETGQNGKLLGPKSTRRLRALLAQRGLSVAACAK